MIALDPADGRILALVGPRVAVRAFPVGSVAKLATTLVAADAGKLDPARRLKCPGPAGVACWKVHGRVDLEHAIAGSCASYFAQVGEELGCERLRAGMRRLGWGGVTGSGIPGEEAGYVPAGASALEAARLGAGDTADLRVTPLQVAVLVGAIANGGTRWRPYVAQRPSPERRHSPGRIPTRGLEALRSGMRLAVVDGSAQAADVVGVDVRGKTGTAPRADRPAGRHGWFAGYEPGCAVVVFLREGTGYRDASPVARAVLEAAR